VEERLVIGEQLLVRGEEFGVAAEDLVVAAPKREAGAVAQPPDLVLRLDARAGQKFGVRR